MNLEQPPDAGVVAQRAIAYHGRDIHYFGVVSSGDWHVKTYAISLAGSGELDRALFDFSVRFAHRLLAAGSGEFASYGAGFLVLHRAREGHFLLVCRWVDENMLMEEVFFSPLAYPFAFERFHDPRITACVWELAVIHAESRCWLLHAIPNGAVAGVADYLACSL